MGPRRTGVYHSFAPNKRYNNPMHISHCLLQEYTRAIELHAFLLRRRLGDAPLASAPLLTYKSRFVERDLPSTSVKCTCSSPTPGATQWSSLRRRNQRLDHSLPLPSAPAHLRGEMNVSASHYHFQSTCIADARSSPVARSTSRPLTTTSSPPASPMPGLPPWRDLRLGHSLSLSPPAPPI